LGVTDQAAECWTGIGVVIRIESTDIKRVITDGTLKDIVMIWVQLIDTDGALKNIDTTGVQLINTDGTFEDINMIGV
jgi:hypothetical protein